MLAFWLNGMRGTSLLESLITRTVDEGRQGLNRED